MAKSMTFAITVSAHYYDPHLWAIKLMSIVKAKSGAFVWRTQKTICTHGELSKLTPMAIEYSIDNNIPYISVLTQGHKVLGLHKDFIEKHFGRRLSELI